MAENLLPLVERRGDETSLSDETGHLTWMEVNQRANRIVSGLRGLGLGPGDPVAILSGNRREYVELVNACGHTGLVNVPVNWHFSAEEVAYILEDSGAKALVTDPVHASLAAEAAAGADGVSARLVFGDRAVEGFQPFEDLVGAGSESEPSDQVSGTTMFYTSGTTGRPKGVKSSLIPVGAPVAVVQMVLEGAGTTLDFPRDQRSLVMAPLYHSGPLGVGLIAWSMGNAMVMRDKFDPAEMLRLIDGLDIAVVYAVPTHFIRLLRLPEEVRRGFDGSSLRYVIHTAAPCPRDVKLQMIDWWGPVIYEGYGATEGGFVTFVTSEEYLKKPGTIGKVLATHELMVVADDGTRLGTNEVGQLYFRNLIGADFEYHGAPDKTAQAHLEPGVYTFGDVGYVDDDGYVFLSDRKIDMIISGGVNIYPAEIEAQLLNHPAVADVAVFGVPNEEYGEEVKAVVELASGQQPSAELARELVAYCREHLAGYKAPRSVDFEELPRTPTGKLLKRHVRERYWAGAGRSI